MPTLENCAQEPIHIPGAIQPHGVLLACALPTLNISQVSANARAFFPDEPDALLGRPLADLFDAETGAQLTGLEHVREFRELNPLRFRARDGSAFDAVLHRSGDALVVELEPAQRDAKENPGRSFDPRMRSALLRMQSARSTADLCERAAEEVRKLTGFDRVMVYRFDAEWNGEVVAESKQAALEPYLGQHYPASDIPEQARRLYTVNWLRFIGDTRYTPQPLHPRNDPATGAPLDMSHSVLRAVSPIHIEYLHNMGVRASMSISIVVEGVLAGLIACHHYASAHVVPFTVRDSAEYLGQALSWQLHLLESEELERKRRASQAHEVEVMRAIASADGILEGLATPALLGLADAQGAAVVLVEGTRRVGNAPSPDVIHALVDWLVGQGHELYHSDCLSSVLPVAAHWQEQAAGVLAVAISRQLREYVIWFRPAVDRTVRWAGDPRKHVTLDGPGKAPRLSPRGSFELWLEVVHGRSTPWMPWQVERADSIRRALLGGVRRRAVELQSLNNQLIDADRMKDEFIATVSHELRTPLNAILGWTDIAQTGAIGPDRLAHALNVIGRNARQQARLVEDLLDVSRIASGKLTLQVEPVELASIVENVVEGSAVAADAKGIRLERTLDSDAGYVLGDAARLQQITSNLLNNAIKFTPKGGTVRVGLRRSGSDLELTVRDNGQGIDLTFLPHAFELFRQQDQGASRSAQGLGLGLALVKRLTELHGGRVSAHSEGVGKGSTFVVRLPMAPVLAAAPESALIGAVPEIGVKLDGMRVLVVEDEQDARELLSRILQHAGASVREAANASEALALLATESFAVIVSDVGMPGMDGLAFVRELRRRDAAHGGRVPAIALTAYTRAIDRTSALQGGFQAHVPKPIDREELLTVVASIAGRL